jgi:hypothetical protein
MVVSYWNVATLADLLTAVREAAVLVEAEGRQPDTVHLNTRSVFLTRQIGSTDLDLLLFDHARGV